MKLFILLVVVLLFVIWKKYQKRLGEQDSQDAASPARELLPCSVCGVHADKASLSLTTQGRYVCVQHREDRPY